METTTEQWVAVLADGREVAVAVGPNEDGQLVARFALPLARATQLIDGRASAPLQTLGWAAHQIGEAYGAAVVALERAERKTGGLLVAYAGWRAWTNDDRKPLLPRLETLLEGDGDVLADTRARIEQAEGDPARWPMPASAAVVLVRAGRLLAVRARKHGGALCLPGGKARYGESPTACATRECAEETGLEVSDLRPLYRAVVDGFDCHTFLAHAAPDAPVEGEEGPVAWVTPDEFLAESHFRAHTEAWMPTLFAAGVFVP